MKILGKTEGIRGGREEALTWIGEAGRPSPDRRTECEVGDRMDFVLGSAAAAAIGENFPPNVYSRGRDEQQCQFDSRSNVSLTGWAPASCWCRQSGLGGCWFGLSESAARERALRLILLRSRNVFREFFFCLQG